MMRLCYDPHMRTTIALEDRLAARARKQAAEEGLSFSAYVARALAADLAHRAEPAPPPPFHLIAVGSGGPARGIDLDRPRALEEIEDEESALRPTPLR